MSKASAKIGKNTANGKTAPGNDRKPITLEMVRLVAPNDTVAANVARTFGKDLPDFHGIADATSARITAEHEALSDILPERALEIHFQRIVGSYVGSAFGAARFYSDKVDQAKRMTQDLEGRGADRDETPDGQSYSGLVTRAANARDFAASLCMQSYAMLALAEGAANAYASLFGKPWQPYQTQAAGPDLASRAGSTELDAFG